MLAVATSILLLAISGAQATKSLGLSLSGPETVTDVDNFVVVATFTNTGDEALKLYNDPRTALSPFPENTFTVSTSDGTVAKFIGAHVKYTLKSATNFLELSPGATADVSHELGAAYNFTIGGQYEVNVSNAFNYQDDSGAPVRIYADVSSMHSAKLQGNLVSSTISKRAMALTKRASFSSCSTKQKSQIRTALTVAATYLANAVCYLTPITSATTRFTTWFGTYSRTSKITVLGVYTNIKNSDPKTYTYDCSCDNDFYGYVHPDNFGYVYICSGFWDAPTSGTDSRAGTIIHESSHFNANGGTEDYVYGQAQAMALAVSNPSQAIMNADNYEFFAENNPALA